MYFRSKVKILPTGVERPWTENELIVTKTDTKGHIIYANSVFLRLAQLTEKQALGKPHNIIRHPEMPRCIFRLLWERLEAKKEIFAFVNNIAMNGDHYWVFAHVTPSLNAEGEAIAYHSNRRKPKSEQIEKIKPIYRQLFECEMQHSSPRDGLDASTALLNSYLCDRGMSYDEFVFSV